MKKSLAIFFLCFLAVHFLCINVYAFGLSAESKAKVHLASNTVVNPVTSFENEERADAKADFSDAFSFFDFPVNDLVFTITKTFSSVIPVRFSPIKPLYILNHVIRI